MLRTTHLLAVEKPGALRVVIRTPFDNAVSRVTEEGVLVVRVGHRRTSVLSCVSLVGCLAREEVPTLAAAHPRRRYHEAKADNHAENCDEVVHRGHCARHTEVLVYAVVDLTCSHLYAGHAYPTYEEDVEPHVEYECEVLGVVSHADARV